MARPQVRIRTAADVLAALRSPEPEIRLAVLATLAAQPQRMLAYGCDVVAELCAQLEEPPGLFTQATLEALVQLPDERVTATCRRLAFQACDLPLIELAITRLSQDPEGRSALGELLFSLEPARALCAARSLRERADLDLRERIRVELWVGHSETPWLDETSLPLWREELAGPLGSRARRALEMQGETALRQLARAGLDPWLLEWAGALGRVELLEQALAGELAGPALRVMAERGLASAAAQPLTRSALPQVRALAWQVLPEPGGLAQALEQEASPEVRAVLAARLAREQPALEPLLILATDPDWRVRGAAAEGLAGLGETAREAARRLAVDARREVQAVGASVLLALEDYEWMEVHLLA